MQLILGTLGRFRTHSCTPDPTSMSLEAKFEKWTAPSSDTEQDKQDRTENMIRQAVRAYPAFRDASINVFVKGSYANNTNVKADSDVDVAVEMTDLFYWDEAQPGAQRGVT